MERLKGREIEVIGRLEDIMGMEVDMGCQERKEKIEKKVREEQKIQIEEMMRMEKKVGSIRDGLSQMEEHLSSLQVDVIKYQQRVNHLDHSTQRHLNYRDLFNTRLDNHQKVLDALQIINGQLSLSPQQKALLHSADFINDLPAIEHLFQQVNQYRHYEQSDEVQELEIYQKQMRQLDEQLDGIYRQLEKTMREQIEKGTEIDQIDMESGWDLKGLRQVYSRFKRVIKSYHRREKVIEQIEGDIRYAIGLTNCHVFNLVMARLEWIEGENNPTLQLVLMMVLGVLHQDYKYWFRYLGDGHNTLYNAYQGMLDVLENLIQSSYQKKPEYVVFWGEAIRIAQEEYDGNGWAGQALLFLKQVVRRIEQSWPQDYSIQLSILNPCMRYCGVLAEVSHFLQWCRLGCVCIESLLNCLLSWLESICSASGKYRHVSMMTQLYCIERGIEESGLKEVVIEKLEVEGKKYSCEVVRYEWKGMMEGWEQRAQKREIDFIRQVIKGWGRVGPHLNNIYNRIQKHSSNNKQLQAYLWKGVGEYLLNLFNQQERYSLVNYGSHLSLSKDSLLSALHSH